MKKSRIIFLLPIIVFLAVIVSYGSSTVKACSSRGQYGSNALSNSPLMLMPME